MKAICKISLALALSLSLSSCATVALEVAKAAGTAAVKGIFDAISQPDDDDDDSDYSDSKVYGIFSPWKPSQTIFLRN